MFDNVNIDDFHKLGFTYSSMSEMIPKKFETYKYQNATNGGGTDIEIGRASCRERV